VAKGSHPFDGLYYTAGALSSTGLGRYGFGETAEEAYQEALKTADPTTLAALKAARDTEQAAAAAKSAEAAANIITASVGAVANITRATLDRRTATQIRHDQERAAALSHQNMLAQYRVGLSAGAPAGGGGGMGWLAPVALVGAGAVVLLMFLRRR
jgi:hypothetical protein